MNTIDVDQLEERLTSGILGQWYVVAKSVQAWECALRLGPLIARNRTQEIP